MNFLSLKKFFAFAGLFLLTAGVSAVAAPTLTQDCDRVEEPVAFNYCITRTQGSQSQDLLYYFHGLGGSADNYFRNAEAAKVRARWEERGVEAPTVVSISFGAFWLLTRQTKDVKTSGMVEAVTKVIIPMIEKKILKWCPHCTGGKRLILGNSMGGFNGAKMVMHAGDLFDRAVLACPAMVNLSPFSSKEEIEDYTTRTGAFPHLVGQMIYLGTMFFPTPEVWEAESLFSVANKTLSEKTPNLMIAIGDKDDWGFQEGAEEFVMLARKLGVDVEWELIPGGRHCTYNEEKAADFLVP